jgi:hypothetical protein
MTALGSYCVPRDWTGLILSMQYLRHGQRHLMTFRTRESLRGGHLQVPGDQWPLLLYHEYSYDPDNPWKGLLRSTILISVSRAARLDAVDGL